MPPLIAQMICHILKPLLKNWSWHGKMSTNSSLAAYRFSSEQMTSSCLHHMHAVDCAAALTATSVFTLEAAEKEESRSSSSTASSLVLHVRIRSHELMPTSNHSQHLSDLSIVVTFDRINRFELKPGQQWRLASGNTNTPCHGTRSWVCV